MPVTFIYGRSGSGKSEYIYNKLFDLVNKGKKVYLIVPEQYTHLAEKKILSKLNSISPLSVEVLSFERLCSRVNSEFLNANSYHIDSAAKNIILSKIINKLDLSFYKNNVIQNGFIELCSNFISEAKKHNISFELLREEANKSGNAVLKQKLNDISLIYEEYEKSIELLNDTEDSLDLLNINIEKSSFFDNATVFFDEFSSFIPKEMDIISKIAIKSENTYISLCTNQIGSDENSPVFVCINQTISKIKKICDKNNIKINKPIFVDNNCKFNAEISHLEKNLYNYSASGSSNGKIEIFYDLNPYYEVKNTAESIIKLVRDEGYRFNEIGVVCSNIDEYSKTIKHIFSEYEIKYFIDKKTSVTEHNIILFILGLLDIYNESYSYNSVFSYLNLGFSNLSDYQVSILENYVLATNVQKNAWLNDEKWTYKIGKYVDKNDISILREKEINAARKLFIDEVLPFHNAIKGKHSAKYFVEKLYEHLINNKLDKKIERYINDFKIKRNINKAKEYSMVWDIIVKVLDSIYTLISDDLMNSKEFTNLLKIAFNQYKTGLIPTSNDEIVIGNIERSIHSGVKILFVLGMSDLDFPLRPAEDCLFTNAEREIMEKDGVNLSDTIVNKLYYNRFLTYKCLTTPSQRLYLSFSVSNFENKPLRPSFVLNLVKRIFNDVNIKTRLDDDSSIDKVTLKGPTIERMLEEMQKDNFDSVWNDVLLYCKNSGEIDLIKKYASFTPNSFKLNEHLTDEFFSDKNFTSISKLQRYRECKFSYFMQYMLKLEEKDVFSVSPADIGTLVHKIFEEICKSISSEKNSFVDVEKSYYEEKIDKYVDEYIDNLLLVNTMLTKRQIYLVKRLKSSIKLSFSALISHIANSKFVPLGYEIYFGDGGIGSVDIKTSTGKVFKIQGVIDRADKLITENGTYVRIVDYKTGNKTFSFSDIFYGLDVQLIVYLNALVNSDDNYKYGGALYFKVDDCIFDADSKYTANLAEEKIKNMMKLKGVILDDEDVTDAYDAATKNRANVATYDQLSVLSKRVFSNITDLCNELVKGNISIKPYKKGVKVPCSYCPYGDICKFDMGFSNYENIVNLNKNEVFEKLEGAFNVD